MRRTVEMVVFFGVLVSGCTSESNRWKEAELANTVNAYQQYLNEYPNSQKSEEVRKRIEQIEFNNCSEKDTKSAYEQFLRKYPDGEFATQVRFKLTNLKVKETSAWEEACKANTFDAYISFYKVYPDSRLSELSQRLLKLANNYTMIPGSDLVEHVEYLKKNKKYMVGYLKIVFGNSPDEATLSTIDSKPIASIEFGSEVTYILLPEANSKLVFDKDSQGLHYVSGSGIVLSLGKSITVYTYK